MPRCIGRLVSDTIDNGRILFYHDDPKAKNVYYHIAIQCNHTSVKDSVLCKGCLEKEKRTKNALIKNNRMYENHPSVLHGTMNDPIPIWSHIEGGEWFKKTIEKGYSVEMGKKQFPDENEVFTFIDTLKDSSKTIIIEALMKKYSVFSKSSANKYIICYYKSKKKDSPKSAKKDNAENKDKLEKKQTKEHINTVEIYDSKAYIINSIDKEVYKIVEIELIPLKIKENQYYYDTKTKDIYDLQFNKLGIFDAKSESIIVHHE